MQYGDWTFYLACWALAQIILLALSLCDRRLARLRRSRPWAWQGVVLLLTATCLYGSDSNKTPSPPPVQPAVRMSGVWVLRQPDGTYKIIGLVTNTTDSASSDTSSATP